MSIRDRAVAALREAFMAVVGRDAIDAAGYTPRLAFELCACRCRTHNKRCSRSARSGGRHRKKEKGKRKKGKGKREKGNSWRKVGAWQCNSRLGL